MASAMKQAPTILMLSLSLLSRRYLSASTDILQRSVAPDVTSMKLSEAHKGNASRDPAKDDSHQTSKAIPRNREIFQPNSAFGNSFAGCRQFNHIKSISSGTRNVSATRWQSCCNGARPDMKRISPGLVPVSKA